jgi:putative cell wall-binding protein
MTRRLIRDGLWVAAAAAAAVLVAVGVSSAQGGAASPHAIDSSQMDLTATNATHAITFADGHTLTLSTTVTGGTWSYNGSRMAFVDSDGAIRTVRFDNENDVSTYAAADGSQRSDPTWDSTRAMLWSAHVSDPSTHVASDVIQYTETAGAAPTTLELPADTNWTHISGGTAYYVQGQQGNDPASIYRFDWVPGQVGPITPTLLVSGASNPASLGYEEYAYTKDDADGHAQVWVGERGNAVGFPVQVTSDPVDHTNLRSNYNSGALTLAWDEGDDVYASDFSGSAASTPVLVAGLTGVPAFQHAIPTTVDREAGANRYKTAVAISAATWAPVGGDEKRIDASAVVLTRGDTFADALGASALAAQKTGPLLMTSPTSLNADAAKEIVRILGTDDSHTVYIVGGTGAVSAAVENQVKALGVKTTRISGPDRYQTAVQVAKAIGATPTAVFVATGVDFPDALSAGAAAGSFDGNASAAADRAVVVLSSGDTMPSATKTYIAGLESTSTKPTLVGVGGAGANALASLHYPNSYGAVGKDRYDTAVIIAKAFFPSVHHYGVATGQNWPDALAGSARLGMARGPLLLTPSTTVSAEIRAYLDANSGTSIGDDFVFGQTDVVSNAVITAYATASGAGTPIMNSTQQGAFNLRAAAPSAVPSNLTPLS